MALSLCLTKDPVTTTNAASNVVGPPNRISNFFTATSGYDTQTTTLPVTTSNSFHPPTRMTTFSIADTEYGSLTKTQKQGGDLTSPQQFQRYTSKAYVLKSDHHN